MDRHAGRPGAGHPAGPGCKTVVAPPETGADRWWAEREATHQDGPALDFDTDAWEARLIEPQPEAPERDAADITQPLPVVKPVLDPDVHDRRRGRKGRSSVRHDGPLAHCASARQPRLT